MAKNPHLTEDKLNLLAQIPDEVIGLISSGVKTIMVDKISVNLYLIILKTTKKQYSAAEKTKIALEAIKGELTIAQISSKYGVHAAQISKWKQQALESMQSGFTNKASKEDNDQHELIIAVSTITRVNQVWSADVIYIRLKYGFVYLVAIMSISYIKTVI